MELYIGEISQRVQVLNQNNSGKEANEFFQNDPRIEGIVVVSDDLKPVGLITRTQFYQSLGRQYGYDLYIQRGINLIMDDQPLTVDYYTTIDMVSTLAMARQQEKLYDYIIVTKDDEYYGAVSIKNLLLKLLEIQVSIAKFQSPLTGLPGNLMIEEKLKALIQKNHFSVLYFDLDNFKPYNDIYGFNEGDGVIQETANIITRNVQRFGRPTDFVGHIGGDDFVAILDHYEFDILCQGILDEFNEKVKGFYNETDLRRGCVFCQNRRGVVETFPLLSLSIAVVTNRNKKYSNIEDVIREAAITKGKCKVIMGSCCCTN